MIHTSFDSPPTASRNKNILFIENSSKDFEFWSQALLQCSPSYSIMQASTGAQGVELCRSNKYDCVILDLGLSDSCFEALHNLVSDRKQPKMAVVVLTRLRNPTQHDIALHGGAKACLLKPCTSAQDLYHAIQNAIASIAQPAK